MTLCIILYKLKFFNKLFNYFGKISYELYLVHYLVYMCVFQLIKLPLYINAIIAIVLSIIVSIVYNYAIKKLWDVLEKNYRRKSIEKNTI